MDYHDVKHGNLYRLTGQTFNNRTAIKAIGGYWDKEESCYWLDLRNMSKSHYQSRVSDTVFKLSRSGVRFQVEVGQ